MVRGGEKGKWAQALLDQGISAIGFEELGDPTNVASCQELIDRAKGDRPDLTGPVLSNLSSQVWAFVHHISEGDFVLMPLKSDHTKPDQHSVAVGRVTGPARFKPSDAEGWRTVRTVDWQDAAVPLSEFPENIRKLLILPPTILRVKHADAVAQVLSAIGDGDIDTGEAQNLMEGLYPDESDRRNVLNMLVDSIGLAHGLAPGSWALTAMPDGWRLNVGPAWIFEHVPASQIDILLSPTDLPADGKQQLGQFGDVMPAPLKVPPGTEYLSISPQRLRQLRGDAAATWALATAHYGAMAAAFKHARTVADPGSHSRRLVAYLRDFLGRPVPDPDYGQALPKPTDRTLAQLANDLYVTEAWLQTILTLWKDKKQIIFYGPPGTGKTFIAQKLAEYVARGAPVEIVQFHPSYSYEDFVQGFRPTEADHGTGFRLESGALLDVATKARQHPEQTYILLIDEINRGNIAKVFGELYFLLEYRNKSMRLLYSRDDFSLPDNLRFVGTMNTADRSIALVDAALRRRFYFVPFFPDEEPIKSVLRKWLRIKAPKQVRLADIVDLANESVNRNAQIGPSYFMRDNLDDEWVKLIWEYAVMPYLEEQFYGDKEALEAYTLEALRSRISAQEAPPSVEGPGVEVSEEETT